MLERNRWILKLRLIVNGRVNYVFFSVTSPTHHAAKRRLRFWVKREWQLGVKAQSIKSLGRLEKKTNREFLRPAMGQMDPIWAVGWESPRPRRNVL